MALNQNQFSISTTKGTLDTGIGAAYSMSAEFYDASPSATIAPGEAVLLAATTNGTLTKVKKGSAVSDAFFGVVLTNPLKDSFAVGDVLEVAVIGTVVMLEASAAITCGDKLQYDPATGKVALRAGSGVRMAVAMEDASGDGVIFRAMILPA
jgi:hypothetical protein